MRVWNGIKVGVVGVFLVGLLVSLVVSNGGRSEEPMASTPVEVKTSVAQSSDGHSRELLGQVKDEVKAIEYEPLQAWPPTATPLPTATATPSPVPETPTPTVEPTAEPTASPVPTQPPPAPAPVSGCVSPCGGFSATRYGGGPAYGDSVDFNGRSVGCPGWGTYSSENSAILAAPPARYAEWPCGTPLTICTSSGQCLDVTRVDACPGCGPNHVDLSEAGIRQLCGHLCGRINGLSIYRR